MEMENAKVKDYISKIKSTLSVPNTNSVENIPFDWNAMMAGVARSGFMQKDKMYQNCMRSVEKRRAELREVREAVCFPIVNRGQVWYDTLTEGQRSELKTWYKAWLDVTKTLVEPPTPVWLY